MIDARVRQVPLPVFDQVIVHLGELPGGDTYDTLLLLSQIGITEATTITTQSFGGKRLGEIGFVSEVQKRSQRKEASMKVYRFTEEQFQMVVNVIAELPGKASFHPLTILSQIGAAGVEEPAPNGVAVANAPPPLAVESAAA